MERQAADQLAKIGDLQQRFGTSAEAIVGRVDGQAERLVEATSAFEQAGDQFSNAGLEVNSNWTRGFKSLTETVGTTLAEHRKEMGHVEENLRLVAARLEELTERLHPSLLPREEWAAVRDS